MHRLCLPSPLLCQPFLSLPLQPVFAPMLQSNPRMLTSGSHPQAIVSSSTPQYPSAEQPTPQALYATVHQSYPHHATQLHAHQPQPATTPTGSQPQSQHAAPSPVQVPAMGDLSDWGRDGWLEVRDRAWGNSPVGWLRSQQVKGLDTRGTGGTHPSPPPDSTRRGRPHTWAVDSHSRICTTQGP